MARAEIGTTGGCTNRRLPRHLMTHADDLCVHTMCRFTWIRDSSFTIYALIRLGFTAEATAFMDFIQARIANASPDAPLQIMFGIRGETELEEVG